MRKKLLFLILTLSICLLLPSTALAADPDGSRISGSTALSKLTQEEIVQLLTENPLALPDGLYEEEPSITAPYAPGRVNPEALQAAAGRLNALRRIAGLPAVELDSALCENAQYGAVLLAASDFSHYPTQPADMDDAFYTLGRAATSSSSIAWGYTLTGAVDGFMDDSDSGNIAMLGHRRWQLNPTMGKVGFGYAGSRTAEKVFDRSGTGCDYDFIGWPASGNFPGRLFDGDMAWSVTLNPLMYAQPSMPAITVTLTRMSDGSVWTLSGTDTYNPNNALYLNVDSNGYGVSNCIIFRPDGVSAYEGTYRVRIDGLTDRSGNPVDFSYQVDFFDYSDPADFVIDEDGVLTRYTGPGGNVTVPDGVTAIGSSAFSYRTDIVSVTLPDSVTTIRGWAFNKCSSLVSINIPNGVTSILTQAFRACDSLTSLLIPPSVTSISYDAFDWCDGLTICGEEDSYAQRYAGENGIPFAVYEPPCFTTGHELTETPAKAATYTEDGNLQYWTCSLCGYSFSDAEGVNKLKRDAWVIPALASFSYNGTSLTVTFTGAPGGVRVLLAGYAGGKLVCTAGGTSSAAITWTPSAAADTLQVFFLDAETHCPVSAAWKSVLRT